MPRMRILTTNEQELFDRPPLFNHCDRNRFFDLPKGLLDIADSLRTPSGQIVFLLIFGYFKATKRFFQPHDFHERDVDAVARALTLQSVGFSADAYAKQTRSRHQQICWDEPLDAQTDALTAAGADRIFSEKIIGSMRNRPELDKLLDQLRPSDVIVVTKYDRLSGSLRDLLDLVEAIKEQGAVFRSLA